MIFLDDASRRQHGQFRRRGQCQRPARCQNAHQLSDLGHHYGRAIRQRQPVGNLSGDNQATLVSTGTTFRLEDDLDDIWGEVSAGVNFLNPSASTAMFAQTRRDDVEGIGSKAGIRVSW